MAENGTITPAQKKAIAALLSERSVTDAAKAAGVPQRTLFRWMDDPAFRLELSKAEGELLDNATRRLLAMQDKALGELENLIDGLGGNVPAAVQLRAIQTVTDSLLRIRELRNVEARLTELEQAVYDNEKKN